MARAVRAKDVTAVSLAKAALEAAHTKAALNAFITLDDDRALAAARHVDTMIANGDNPGDLAGVPIVIKDNINVAGMRTTAGTPAIDYVADVSAPVAARLEAAGAVIIGKTNMHELAFGVTSDNATYGTVHNPVDPSRIPGGSSGGTAAAVAAGIVPAGLGSDTAGSVRLPAALCGVVGLRPTTWRVDQAGVVPSVPTFDVVGPLARNVQDAALMNAVTTGAPMPDRRAIDTLRLGVARPYIDNLSPAVATAFDDALATLRKAGATLVDIDLTSVSTASFEIGYPVGFFEMKRALSAFLAPHQAMTDLQAIVDEIASDDVKAVYVNAVLGDDAPDEAAYRQAIARIGDVKADYLRHLDGHGIEALVFPAAPLEAQPIEGLAETVMLNGQAIPTTPAYIRNLAPTVIYGAPGLSLPLATNGNALPVGLELDGVPDGDADLLSIGLAVEAALATD
ncbi:MAG: amidase family protein [Pseudomonadota bacterium]